MANDVPDETVATRRRFLIALGAGAAGIAGYRLMAHVAPASGAADARPKLREGLSFDRDTDGYCTLTTQPGSGPLFAVNASGETVLRCLDGRHTIPELARRLAAGLGLPHDGALEAALALFVAEVAQAGLLAAPFYAYLIERSDG